MGYKVSERISMMSASFFTNSSLRSLSVLLFLMSIFLGACGQGNVEPGPTTPVVVTMEIPSGVSGVDLTVTDTSGTELRSVTTDVIPGERVTLSLDVPSGPSRTVTAIARDSQGKALYRGQSEPLDLEPGVAPSEVIIQMLALPTTSTVIVTLTTDRIDIGGVNLTVDYDETLVEYVLNSAAATGAASGSTVSSNVVTDSLGNKQVIVGLINSTGFSEGEILQLTFQNVGEDFPSTDTYRITIEVADVTGNPILGVEASIQIINQ